MIDESTRKVLNFEITCLKENAKAGFLIPSMVLRFNTNEYYNEISF